MTLKVTSPRNVRVVIICSILSCGTRNTGTSQPSMPRAYVTKHISLSALTSLNCPSGVSRTASCSRPPRTGLSMIVDLEDAVKHNLPQTKGFFGPITGPGSDRRADPVRDDDQGGWPGNRGASGRPTYTVLPLCMLSVPTMLPPGRPAAPRQAPPAAVKTPRPARGRGVGCVWLCGSV